MCVGKQSREISGVGPGKLLQYCLLISITIESPAAAVVVMCSGSSVESLLLHRPVLLSTTWPSNAKYLHATSSHDV